MPGGTFCFDEDEGETAGWHGMQDIEEYRTLVDVFDVSVPTSSGFQALGLTNYWTENEVITTAMAGTGADLPYVYVEKKGFLTRAAS